jgi:hypothetical protein
MPLTSEAEDVTAVMRRHAANKATSTLIGLGIALCSAAGSYFAYRQAKIEAHADTTKVRSDAAVGYRTLADPVAMVLELYKTLDARVATIETQVRECQVKQTPLAPAPPAPSGLVPIDSLQLLHPLPKTLGEATAAAQ